MPSLLSIYQEIVYYIVEELFYVRSLSLSLSSLHEDIGVACFMTSLVSSFLAALGWQIL